MARVRVPIVTGQGGVQAMMPSFQEVSGSYQGDAAVVSTQGILVGVPLGDPRLAAVTVQVDVPDDEVNQDGTPNKARIRAKYPDHPFVKAGRFN